MTDDERQLVELKQQYQENVEKSLKLKRFAIHNVFGTLFGVIPLLLMLLPFINENVMALSLLLVSQIIGLVIIIVVGIKLNKLKI